MTVQKIVSLEESTFELQHKTKCENFSTEYFFPFGFGSTKSKMIFDKMYS